VAEAELRKGKDIILPSAVGCYSPRAKPILPIALPTSWTALERGLRPNAFTLGAKRRKV
jgi:DNA primase